MMILFSSGRQAGRQAGKLKAQESYLGISKGKEKLVQLPPHVSVGLWVLSTESLVSAGKWYLDYMLGLIVLCLYRVCFGFPHPHISTSVLKRVTSL